MNGTSLGLAEFTAMLDAGLAEVIQNHNHLTELDSVSGDGDHGISMLRAAGSLRELLREPMSDISTVLSTTGELLLTNDGGASGSLLGSFFLGAANACMDKDELDCGGLSAVFASGLSAMKRYTEAKPGNKTMLDALEPAIDALQNSGAQNQDLQTALEMAAEAAWDGARRTKEMRARFGRAQHLGERTLGWQDPGATTISLLFRGFANGIKTYEQSKPWLM